MEAIELKKLLSQAREQCPRMRLIDYQLVDYLAANLNDWTTPDDVASTLLMLLDDIIRYRYDHNAVLSSKDMPGLIRRMYNAALMRAPHILRTIGAVSGPEYTNEVRRQCWIVLGWRSAQGVRMTNKEIPDSVKEAVTLCAKWLPEPPRKGAPAKRHEAYTEAELWGFRFALAELMMNDFSYYSPEILSFRQHDDKPHPMLMAAASSAGITLDRFYPLNFDFRMIITPNRYSLMEV